MRLYLPIACMALWFTMVSAFAEEASKIRARFDCIHLFNADKGSNQNCITVSALKLRLSEVTSPSTKAYIELDPFSGPDELRNNMPGSLFYPERASSQLISDFAFLWTPRPSLLVRFGVHAGMLPEQLKSSGGSFEGTLLSGPWKQFALTIAYRLALFDSFDVEMTVGNGEGELFENLDPQQYFSFLAKAQLSPAFWAGLGVSLDGNSYGSRQTTWLKERLATSCPSQMQNASASERGFQTQRALLFFGLDGTKPGWEGFKTVFSHRRVVKRDLDSTTSYWSGVADCKIEDWSWFLPESPDTGVHNTLELQQNSIGLGYRILDTAEIGFDFAALTAKSTEVDFLQTCELYQDGGCQQLGQNVDKADQTSYSISLAFDFNEKLRFNTEYHARAYDRIYNQAYYKGRNNSGGKEVDLFNAGFLYNFDR